MEERKIQTVRSNGIDIPMIDRGARELIDELGKDAPPFQLAIDEETGEYGYIKKGETVVTPFSGIKNISFAYVYSGPSRFPNNTEMNAERLFVLVSSSSPSTITVKDNDGNILEPDDTVVIAGNITLAKVFNGAPGGERLLVSATTNGGSTGAICVVVGC